MKRALPLFLAALIAIVAVPRLSLAQNSDSSVTNNSDDADDASPVARVARLRFVDGDVSFLRAGTNEWAPAVENLPLLAGDQIYVPTNARAEIQLSAGSYIRLFDNALLTITDLSDSLSQMELTEGAAIVGIDRLATGARFEIDLPNAAAVFSREGLYRLRVLERDQSEVSVRRGSAEVSTDDGTVRVREGYRLAVDTNSGEPLQLAADVGSGAWEEQGAYTHSTISQAAQSQAPDDVQTYESNYDTFYGASDLSSYGTWTSDASYGNCWVPRVGSDWAPYRYGQWTWIPRVGWSWLAEERWGWAPYHYGRWAYVSGLGWAWIPGFGSGGVWSHNYWDYRWRPSLVYFFNYPTSRGNYVGWYPLTPGQRWHRPEWYDRHGDRGHLHLPSPRDRALRPGDERQWLDPPRNPRGVTTVAVDAFQRPTRSTGKIEARPPADWNNKSARAGLPSITPDPGSSLLGNGGHVGRHVATPPIDAISRSVVTRNRPSNPDAESTAPRERRLITPRPAPIITDETIRRSREHARDKSASGTDSSSNGSDGRSADAVRDRAGKYRIPLPHTNDGTTNNGNPSSNQGQATDVDGQRKAERLEQKRLMEQEHHVSPPPPPDQSHSRGETQNHPGDQHPDAKSEQKQEKQQHREEKRAAQEQPRKP